MEEDSEPSGAEVERLLKAALQDQAFFRSAGDKNGEANALYQAADLHAATGNYEEAIASGEEAAALFLEAGNPEEQAAVMRTVTQFHLGNGDSRMALEVAEQALRLSKAVENAEGEAEMLLMIARVNMEVLEGVVHDTSFAESPIPMKVMAVVRKAAEVARALEDKKMETDALCILSQACSAANQFQSAAYAASQAAAIHRENAEYYDEAHTSLMAANGYLASKEIDKAWESVSVALLLFRELEDEEGQTQAEDLIDKIDAIKPIESVSDPKKAPVMAQAEQPVKEAGAAEQAPKPAAAAPKPAGKPAEVSKPAAPKRPVTKAFMHMMEAKMRWAMEDFDSCDDTPLMKTSFNWLPKAPVQNDLGVSVPMPDTWELQAWSEQHAPPARVKVAVASGTAAAGGLAMAGAEAKATSMVVATSAIASRVKTIVSDLVGMDDLGYDNPLMSIGMTSQSAVLLREALTKEFPGPSLPFTMMFDYPSINGISEYLGSR